MKITWSPLATQRVLEAAEVIALDKPAAALRWAEATFEGVKQLETFPKSGRMVPELQRPEVRELIRGSYRIIYRIAHEQLLILTVRHSSQSFDRAEVE